MEQQQKESSRAKDWRNERLAEILDSGMGADVYFLVGKPGEEKQLISTHKFMLSAASDVFKGQFFRFNETIGTKEGTDQKPIEVTDISPDIFRAMLRFIYSYDFSGVNKQNVLAVYYAGDKYMIAALVSECRQFLMNGRNLSVENMFSVLKHAQHHGDKDLTEHCWAFVDSHIYSYSSVLIRSEEFYELDPPFLCEFFSRNTLKAVELSLFQNLHAWAVRKCETEGLELTPENKRMLVGAAIYQIRFPLIDQQEFTKHIVPSGLLANEDIVAMYLHHYTECRDCAKVMRRVTVPKSPYCCNCAEAKYQYPIRFGSQHRYSKGYF